MKDFALELGCLGFTMRLKRLADALIQDGKRMYKELGVDIEPNWYVIFRLLKREGEMSVTEISERIGMAHPSVIALTNKMMKAGYLSSNQCTDDSRRRLLNLSDKALEALPQLEEIWNAGERGVINALEGTNTMEILSLIEQRFSEKGFRERTIEELNKNS
ncbi:MarR family winged helix-turn-helix transcriptional regulator [Marinoscillum furvescens]|uniref:DNA-binding MarR family transcriptional regulator n=1 Tax=Marinoscillum furvescens DSM 4134 TaxID=1122208 RepID=A0A3D9L2J2_MARFU|nr:MarR family transcriptional regulator [Marinoscillum furvescens]RED96604.1 DNA-binding MarR family transcriptional regulator [Marinoscillum furvescens DSM 4134]